jgi:hypothetical protein
MEAQSAFRNSLAFAQRVAFACFKALRSFIYCSLGGLCVRPERIRQLPCQTWQMFLRASQVSPLNAPVVLRIF